MEAPDELEPELTPLKKSPLRPQEETPFVVGKPNMAPRNEHPFFDDPLRMTQSVMGAVGGALPWMARAGTAAYSTITNPPPIVKDAVEKIFDLRSPAPVLGAAQKQGGLRIGENIGQREAALRGWGATAQDRKMVEEMTRDAMQRQRQANERANAIMAVGESAVNSGQASWLESQLKPKPKY